MKKQQNNSTATIVCCLVLFGTILLLQVPVGADWLKWNNPPDADKYDHGHTSPNYKPTCWVAAASNMLAGAGYGDGNTVQERADDIYDELCYGGVDCNDPGWADTALRAWLRSDDNKWKRYNPYKYVFLYGEPDCKRQREPWQNTELPEFIGNELRDCHSVRLSILKVNKSGGHAITAWGDDGGGADLTENPDQVKVADSDYSDVTQAIQTYSYDDYNNPNPGGGNRGVGWYINYNYEDSHRYIDNVVTLDDMPNTIDLMSGASIGLSQFVTASYKIHQSRVGFNAVDLHYKVGSNKMFGYLTKLDWDTNNVPTITETNNPPTQIRVNWDLSDNPVPHCNNVTITTRLNIPWVPGTQTLYAITYTDVNFSYADIIMPKPDIGWRLTNPDRGLSGPVDPNATGGYVVGGFKIYADAGGSTVLGEYRLIHEYDYSQDPNIHIFEVNQTPGTFYVGTFMFGHSYAYLDDEALWNFSDWWTIESMIYPMWQPVPPVLMDWSARGLWPYPKGQDYTKPPPEKCGDAGTSYASGDIDKDCDVDLDDFGYFAATWLDCTDPNQANCP